MKFQKSSEKREHSPPPCTSQVKSVRQTENSSNDLPRFEKRLSIVLQLKKFKSSFRNTLQDAKDKYYNRLFKLFPQKKKYKCYKIVILGGHQVGKSEFIKWYVNKAGGVYRKPLNDIEILGKLFMYSPVNDHQQKEFQQK